ncbi:MAG: hypothetical protein JO286_09710 [Solirubrobacterales bacterium]|nr:hypothetical protein [Solirubrobacterales bacterium]MBV9681621.1 hypothetical protein [Solirubrobacterales bacterium]MBV9807445.1 hypothetical protein [Solirubrobacterales bacterium]
MPRRDFSSARATVVPRWRPALAASITLAALAIAASAAAAGGGGILPGRGIGPLRLGMTRSQVLHRAKQAPGCGCGQFQALVPGGTIDVVFRRGRVSRLATDSPRYRFLGVGVGSYGSVVPSRLGPHGFRYFSCRAGNPYNGFWRPGILFEMLGGRVRGVEVARGLAAAPRC